MGEGCLYESYMQRQARFLIKSLNITLVGSIAPYYNVLCN